MAVPCDPLQPTKQQASQKVQQKYLKKKILTKISQKKMEGEWEVSRSVVLPKVHYRWTGVMQAATNVAENRSWE